jgi:hypothetical protein
MADVRSNNIPAKVILTADMTGGDIPRVVVIGSIRIDSIATVRAYIKTGNDLKISSKHCGLAFI